MTPGPVLPAQSALAAYRTYAEQVSGAFRRGLTGEKTTSTEISGSCNAILDALGANVDDIPVTPEKVWEAMKAA